jgi:hypothetical protein
MPTLEFSLTDNNGIYELYTFDEIFEYSTYLDPKYGASILVTRFSYDKVLKNFKALPDDVYSVNEVK